jgi:hypothetical protein
MSAADQSMPAEHIALKTTNHRCVTTAVTLIARPFARGGSGKSATIRGRGKRGDALLNLRDIGETLGPMLREALRPGGVSGCGDDRR